MEEFSGISNALKSLGFTQNEATVYLYILKFGESYPGTLARCCNIKRSTIYGVLEGLEEKGICFPDEKNGQKIYNAISPKELIERQKEKLFDLDLYATEVERLLKEKQPKQHDKKYIKGSEMSFLGEVIMEKYEKEVGGIVALFVKENEGEHIELLQIGKNTECEYAIKIAKKAVGMRFTSYINPQNEVGKTVKEAKKYTGTLLQNFLFPAVPSFLSKEIQKKLNIVKIASLPVAYRKNIVAAILVGFRSEKEYKEKLPKINRFFYQHAKYLFLAKQHEVLRKGFLKISNLGKKSDHLFIKNIRKDITKFKKLSLNNYAKKILHRIGRNIDLFEREKLEVESESAYLLKQVKKIDK